MLEVKYLLVVFLWRAILLLSLCASIAASGKPEDASIKLIMPESMELDISEEEAREVVVVTERKPLLFMEKRAVGPNENNGKGRVKLFASSRSV